MPNAVKVMRQNASPEALEGVWKAGFPGQISRQAGDRGAETTHTAQELYDRMLELHPNRVNPGWALWSSARAVKGTNHV